MVLYFLILFIIQINHCQYTAEPKELYAVHEADTNRVEVMN